MWEQNNLNYQFSFIYVDINSHHDFGSLIDITDSVGEGSYRKYFLVFVISLYCIFPKIDLVDIKLFDVVPNWNIGMFAETAKWTAGGGASYFLGKFDSPPAQAYLLLSWFTNLPNTPRSIISPLKSWMFCGGRRVSFFHQKHLKDAKIQPLSHDYPRRC